MPVCVAIHDRIGMISFGLAAVRIVPDQFPERFRPGAGTGEGVGVGAGVGAATVGGGVVAVGVGVVGVLEPPPHAISTVQATTGKKRVDITVSPAT